MWRMANDNGIGVAGKVTVGMASLQPFVVVVDRLWPIRAVFQTG